MPASDAVPKLGKMITHRGLCSVERNRVGAQVSEIPESIKCDVECFVDQTQATTHFDASTECCQRRIAFKQLISIASFLNDFRQEENTQYLEQKMIDF